MKSFFCAALGVAILSIPAPAHAQEQEVAPIFEQVPAVLYETYKGVNRPAFNEYFEMLVAQVRRDRWNRLGDLQREPQGRLPHHGAPRGARVGAKYPASEGGKLPRVQRGPARSLELCLGTRHVAVYNAAPGLSYVPEGFTVEDIRDLPYNRTQIYHLKWDQAPAFRAALRRRAELDREGGIDNFVLTAWNGGIGTEAQTVMVRVSAESLETDRAALAERMRIRREGYWDAWSEQTQIMNNAAWHVERHNQTRRNQLSYPVRP